MGVLVDREPGVAVAPDHLPHQGHQRGGEVFAAGSLSLRRWDGARFVEVPGARPPLFGLYVQGPKEVWLAGKVPQRYDGATFTTLVPNSNGFNEWPWYTVYSPSAGRALFFGGTIYDTLGTATSGTLPAAALASGGTDAGAPVFWVGSEGQSGIVNP